jgi:aryl-alcohol dehydrogenase-like predicted oxidoreductase
MSQDLGPKLGKTVSPYCFGVMQFGGKADEAASRRLFDRCREAGITMFDAAYVYTNGRAEALLGEFAEAERDDLILISKCLYQPGQRGPELEAQAAESLKRLRTDHVDVLYLHRWPGDDLLDETLLAMKTLHENGAFTLLGASNFAAWQVMKAQWRAAELGAPRIEILQPMYNLVKRQAEVEILPMAISEGLTTHTYSPLGGGLLTGKYAAGGGGRLTEDEMYQTRYGPAWMHAAAMALAGIAAERHIPAPALAVAWVAAHPGVSAPIISASAPDQLEASLAGLEVDMTDALYHELAALVPAPPPATDRLEEAAPPRI